MDAWPDGMPFLCPNCHRPTREGDLNCYNCKKWFDKPEVVVNEKTKRTRQGMIDFLVETLIPDLRESGTHATADDFEACVRFMKDPTLNEFEQELNYS